MTIETRYEFETIPAWKIIAGCSLGTWTPQEVAIELLEVLEVVAPNLETKKHWKDIAKYNQDIVVMTEMQGELVELLNDHANLPAYCHIVLNENQWQVTPFIIEDDDDLPQVDDYPDERYEDSDHVLLVNDHGNINCLEWDCSRNEYRTIWAMV